MKSLARSQHLQITLLAFVSALGTGSLIGLWLVALTRARPFLPMVVMVPALTISALVFVCVLWNGYRAMPRQIATFRVDGLTVGDRLIEWREVKRATRIDLFGRTSVTLESGEKIAFWVAQSSDAVFVRGRERLSSRENQPALIRRQAISGGIGFYMMAFGTTMALGPGTSSDIFIDAMWRFGPLFTAVIGAMFCVASISRRLPAKWTTDPLDLELLEPGVRYRDEKGREYLVSNHLAVTENGKVTLYSAQPARSMVAHVGQIYHYVLSQAGDRPLTYCTRLLERVGGDSGASPGPETP